MDRIFKNLTKASKNKWKFESLKITGHVSTPIFLTDPLNFDSIIFFSFIRYYLGSAYYNLPSGIKLFNNSLINLPLKKNKNEEYYLSSIGDYEKQEFVQKYRKRYNEVSINEWCKAKKLITGKGKYKNHDRPMILSSSDKIEFFCVGDKNEISKILKTVQAIGKKQSQGFGIVQYWKIESQASIKIIRGIPSDEQEAVGFKATKPPYFSRYGDKNFYKYQEVKKTTLG